MAFVSGGYDRSIKMWCAHESSSEENEFLVKTFAGPVNSAVNSVAFQSTNNTIFAAAGKKLWSGAEYGLQGKLTAA